MTKKEAMNYCKKMFSKSTVKAWVSMITAAFAIGNLYKNAYNMGVYETGRADIETAADDNDEITLTINGKKV